MGVWVEGAPKAPTVALSPDAEKHEPGEHSYSLHGPGQLGSTATTGRDKEYLPPHPHHHKRTSAHHVLLRGPDVNLGLNQQT